VPTYPAVAETYHGSPEPCEFFESLFAAKNQHTTK